MLELLFALGQLSAPICEMTPGNNVLISMSIPMDMDKGCVHSYDMKEPLVYVPLCGSPEIGFYLTPIQLHVIEYEKYGCLR